MAVVLARPQVHFGAIVLVPTLIWYAIVVVSPVVQTIRISLLNYRLLDPGHSSFVGLQNFATLITSPRFGLAVGNTLAWALFAFVFIVPISLLLAWCLVSVGRGRTVYQAVVFLPVVVSLVAVATLFRILMDPEVGLLNAILRGLGLPESRWLSSSDTALPVLAAISAWKSLGIYVVILVAGMLNIPAELYDAARVDGASAWQTFRRITLPLLGNVLALVTVLLTIGSLQEFTLPTVIYGSAGAAGPGESTFLYNQLIYDEAFTNVRFGTASAGALLQFAVILIFSLVWMRLLRPRWSQ